MPGNGLVTSIAPLMKSCPSPASTLPKTGRSLAPREQLPYLHSLDYYSLCTCQAVPVNDKDQDVSLLIHKCRGSKMTHRLDLLKGSPMLKLSMTMTVILYFEHDTPLNFLSFSCSNKLSYSVFQSLDVLDVSRSQNSWASWALPLPNCSPVFLCTLPHTHTRSHTCTYMYTCVLRPIYCFVIDDIFNSVL